MTENSQGDFSNRISAEVEAKLQYENALNADIRRQLYRFAVPPRDLWSELAEGMGLEGHEKHLDVATGSGIFLTILESKHHHVGEMVGLDLYHSQFDEQQRRIQAVNPQSRIAFQQGDAQSTGFEAATFDSGSETFGGYHMEDPLANLHEIRRVVKRGGRIGYATRDETSMPGIWAQVQIAADYVGAVIPENFYSRFNIATSGFYLGEMFEVVSFIEQDSVLEIPVDLEKPGDMIGWKYYRAYFLSLVDSMIDIETGQPLSQEERQMLVGYVDEVVLGMFIHEFRFREREEGRGYVKDRLHQAAWVLENTKAGAGEEISYNRESGLWLPGSIGNIAAE